MSSQGLTSRWLAMSALKPKIAGFVQVGIESLNTEEMKRSIQESFARDGRFEVIRERAEQLLETFAGQNASSSANYDESNNNVFNLDMFLAAVPEGEEVDRDDVDFVEDEIAWKSDNEEDDSSDDDDEEDEYTDDGEDDLAREFSDELDAILSSEM